MTTGYYLDADANGNLGFFLASNNTELMYISDVGDLSVSGNLTTGSQQAILWTNTTSGSVGGFTAIQYTNRFAMYPTTDNNNLFTIENTSLSNVFVVDPSTNSVTTVNNTLDNGSGAMSVSDTLTVSGEISGGSYNLIGGTGISFSGTTITNTGVTSITAGTNITISGSTGDVTINASGGGSSYTAGNGISISSSTIAMSGVMTVTGPAGFKIEGDANDPTIEVYDTANSSYTIEIGQASSAGAYFTNANVGDSIIRGNYERLLLGVTAEDAGLILTNGYVVTTKNNTLDSGSGGLTIAGTAIGGFAQFFNSGTLRPTSLPFTYSVTVPAGTWAGYVSVGMFLLPNNSVYSYELSVNLSGSAFVSGTVTGSSPLTDLNGGSGSNYPLTNFPSMPITLKSSGGTITFSVNNSNSTNGMTSILGGNSDSAFQVSVFLVSTSTAS